MSAPAAKAFSEPVKHDGGDAGIGLEAGQRGDQLASMALFSAFSAFGPVEP